MYKLSTLSRKMALKLSRACGSTRDSGKLPFIASQTMGRLTASRMITHTYTHVHTHTSDSAMPDNSASHYLHFSGTEPPSLTPSLRLLQRLLLSSVAARFHVVNIMQNNSFLFAAAPHLPSSHPPLRIPSLMGAKRCKLAEREGLLYTHHCGYLPLCLSLLLLLMLGCNRRA